MGKYNNIIVVISVWYDGESFLFSFFFIIETL